MKVFISHQKDDSISSNLLSIWLTLKNVDIYLDIVDDALAKDGPDLSEHIRSRMSDCDQLIAVISASTRSSWWVPWEIGAATEKNFKIASYTEESVALPSYLEKWPVMKNFEELELYWKHSNATEAALNKRLHEAKSSITRDLLQKSQAAEFHRSLKRAIAAHRR